MRRYRITRSDALQAIDHNALARLQTGLDHPAALLVRAQANFAVSRLVAVVDHDHEALVLIRAYRLLIDQNGVARRSEEHTSELQSLMRISYAVFCLKKKKKHINQNKHI